MKVLIKNILLINHNEEKICDILIKDDKIGKIGEKISVRQPDLIIDGTGKIAFPGLVDIHCHLRDPGLTYKEDIKSGSKSAAKGGFTTIVAMPNTDPVVDNKSVVEYIKKEAEKNSKIRVYQAGSISKDLKGKELSKMGEMKEAGIVAVTDDGLPVQSSSLLKKALLYAKMLDLPLISHSEDLDLKEEGVMNEGYMSTLLGLRGINKAVEESAVARDILIAKNTDTSIHITHISTKGSVNIIREAKKEGVKVTCDTCPHYFSLTDKMCDNYNTNAKMNPPLREEEDVKEIIRGLKDGTIDLIATDHAPHHIDEKNCEFDKALNGIIGFETAFAVAYKYLVKENNFTLPEIIKLLSYNPAKLLKLNGGEIKTDSQADLVIADINCKYKYSEREILSKSKNTPYIGFEFLSRIEKVFCDGKIAYNSEV